MFRLIKLAFYAMLGYALYELYQGMSSESTGSRGRRRGNLDRALNESGGRMQTLTGRGSGMHEDTLDRDGGSIPHQVGRGVVTR